MLKYSYAYSGGERNELVHSKAFGRPSMTASYFVRADYEKSSGGIEECIGCIKYFVKAQAIGEDNDDDTPTLRFAVADLISVSRDGTASGILWKGLTSRARLYGILFEDMKGKVISARPPSERSDAIWLVPYANLSG